jgi:hypothetical protein
MLSKIHPRYWALLALIAWGGSILYFGTTSFTPYGISEGAATALLMNWSVVGNVANPIVTFGMPDFRALLFIPLAIYWPGSILAAKVFTLLITFITAMFLHNWSKNRFDSEVALIATGLFLIAPITITQMNAIGTGPFLLLMFCLGMWADKKHRTAERSIGSWYFLQMLLVAIAVTLHPIGLAYPLTLTWQWHKTPVDKKRQQHIFIGLGATVFVILVMQAGWIGIDWFKNPLTSLNHVLFITTPLTELEPGLFPGIVVFTLAVVVVAFAWRRMIGDMLGTTLLLAAAIGLLVAENAWAMIILTIILYEGTPLLIKLNKSIPAQNFIGQRGVVMISLLVTATIFMQTEKLTNTKKDIHIASQWPARTMLAVKRPVWPLPPPAENGEELLKKIKGVNYLIFDHNDPNNSELARNIADVGGKMETISLQSAGVIVKVRDQNENQSGNMEK